MENILKYYEFSEFIKDDSGTFSSIISYSELNPQHFLIFQKKGDTYDLFVTQYKNKKSIGNSKPEILELVIQNYDKSMPEHRIAIRKYFE